MAYKNFRCTEIIEEIGEELRRVRKQKKLTISHVAEQVSAASGLPVSNTLLGRIETGERRIDDEIMEAICAFYGVHSREIVIAAARKHIQRLSGETAGDEEQENRGASLMPTKLRTMSSMKKGKLQRPKCKMEHFAPRP